MRYLLLATVAVAVAAFCLLVSVEATPHRVWDLPGLATQTPDEMYTGYLSTGDAYDSQLFYWLAKARNPEVVAMDVPIIVWLQGGPGCSGGLGWFMELGPYILFDDGHLDSNPYAWNERAHLLYIDQPIGSGLSTLGPKGTNDTYVTTIEEQTAQLFTALRNFFKTEFPEFRRNPLTLTGESYAGKYIPNLATAILANTDFPLNLVSIAIGDGWVAPLDQTSVYGDQAYQLGLIDDSELPGVNKQFANCTDLVENKKWHEAQVECDDLLNRIVAMAGNINVDDVREFGSDIIDDRLGDWFSLQATKEALGLINPPVHYEPCSGDAANALSLDEMMPSVHLLPALVKNLKQVFIYEGQFDLNCGVTGVEKYLKKLYPSEMASTPKNLWADETSSTATFGWYRELTPSLTFIMVQNAGHMVPKTQPAAAATMITHLLAGTPLVPRPQAKRFKEAPLRTDLREQREIRQLRLPHYHHMPSMWSTSMRPLDLEEGKSLMFIQEPASSKAALKAADPLVVLTPSGGTFTSQSVLSITWTGGDPTWSLELTLVDAETSNVLNVPSLDNSLQAWQIGLPAALPCDELYRVRLTAASVGAVSFSPAFTVSCLSDLTILEPSAVARWPQGATVPMQWTGGSPDWKLNITLVKYDSLAVVELITESVINSVGTFEATLPEPLDCTRTFLLQIHRLDGEQNAVGQPMQVDCPWKDQDQQQAKQQQPKRKQPREILSLV